MYKQIKTIFFCHDFFVYVWEKIIWALFIPSYVFNSQWWNLRWDSQFSVPGEKHFKSKKINNSNTWRKLNISVSHSQNPRKLHFGPVMRSRDRFLESICWQTFSFSILYHEEKKYWLVWWKDTGKDNGSALPLFPTLFFGDCLESCCHESISRLEFSKRAVLLILSSMKGFSLIRME